MIKNRLFLSIISAGLLVSTIYPGNIKTVNASDAAICCYFLEDCTVELEDSSFNYTGEAIEPEVTVSYEGKVLDSSCYDISYSNNTEVGTAAVAVTANGETYYENENACYYLKGETSVTFLIAEQELGTALSADNLDYCNIVIDSDTYCYTGDAIEPEVTVITSYGSIVNDACYSVSYTDNVEIGTATITVESNDYHYINGNSEYLTSGSTSTTFEIAEHDYVADCAVGGSTSDCYVSGWYQYVCSRCGDTYRDSYSYYDHNFVDGVCTNCGALEDESCSAENGSSNVDSGSSSSTNTTGGTTSNDSSTGTENEGNSGTNNEGDTAISGTDEDTDSRVGSAVWAVNLAACDITLSKTSYTYTGKALTPSVIIKLDNEVISSDYYTVTYTNNKNAGTATVTIKGKMVGGSGCKGKLTATFTIKKATHKNVKITQGSTYTLGCTGSSSKKSIATVKNGKISAKKVGVTKVTSKNYKTFTVTVIPKKTKVKDTWNNKGNVAVTLKKVSNATGYEVWLSTSKSFTSAKAQKVRGQKLTFAFSNLSKNKIYYVRARSYVIKNGKKYYSNWSNIAKTYSC